MIGLEKVKIGNSILGVLLVYDKLLMQGNSDHTPYIYYLIWQGFSGSLLTLLTGTGEDGEQNGTDISKNLCPLFLGELAFLLWIVHQCKKEIDYAWWHRCIRLGVTQKLQACRVPRWMKEWLRIEVMGQDSLLVKKKRKILQTLDHPEEFVPEAALEGWYRGLCCRSLYLDREITTIPPYMLAYADISDKLMIWHPIQDVGEKACYRATLPAVVELTGPYPLTSKKSSEAGEDKGLLQISEQAFAHTAGLACLQIKGYTSGWIRTQSIFQANDLQFLTIQVREVISLDRGAIAACSHLRVVVLEGLGLKTHPHWEAVKDCPALEYLKIPKLINPEHVVQASFSGSPALKKLIIADKDYVRTAWRQAIAEGQGFTVISHSTSHQQAYEALVKESGIGGNMQRLQLVLNKQDAEWGAGFDIPLSWVFYGRKEILAASIQKSQKTPAFTLPLRWRRYLGVYSDPLVGQGFFSRKESCYLHEALCLAKKSHSKARLYPLCGDANYASASVWDLYQRLSQGQCKSVPA